MEFQVGDWVFLKVVPRKGIIRFNKKGKLAPRFIGPFCILEKIGQVAYRLELPSELDRIHDVFHVSMLRKYHPDPTHVIQWEAIGIQPDHSYDEGPIKIVDRQVRVLRNKEISLVKVIWLHHGTEEATWEAEEDMRTSYPHLFETNFEDEIS